MIFNEIRNKIDLTVRNSIGNLRSRVGVFRVELIQTTDSSPTTFDQAGGHLLRPAVPARQSYELTKWIGEVFQIKRD